ncbi:MAG: ParB/RepB/Spo0J family partition protein [Flavobacteriaceae bacterium]|jgi:ParB family chromosome partitioning protein|nr:ParB/RepB/Spo0J family partition protein [Flavobacteriaceae bacterium]MDG1384161.1 ParB/RepB/Spo0J family partition protein [Flavobacteriaceae bacterium]
MAKAFKKQALGRGLSALLQDSKVGDNSLGVENNSTQIGTIVELELDFIEVNPFQPRTQFKEETIRELASSIQELGVIQPITVRETKANTFQLVSGERRFRASKLLDFKTIPAYIRVANDQEALEMALVENIQRQDLDPIEIALSYQRLIEDIQLTQEQMSQRVGKKRSTIANYLRLLKLDPLIQTGMRDGFISMGHGRAIVNINSHADQITIYKEILANKLSVRATETLVKSYNTPKAVKPTKNNDLPEFVKNGVQKIASYFGHKIEVKMEKKGGGKILIPFHSEEDYDRILKLIERDK